MRTIGYAGAAVAVGAGALSLAGFGMAGIAAGSAAAAWQSSIGSVATGSTFATLQSLGATGWIATTFGGGAAAASGAYVADRKMDNKTHKDHQDRGKAEKKK